MARKIRLEYIQNDIARKKTFKKRKTGVVKKLNELTTLCAIQACLVIYSMYDAEPFVWPSNDEARRLIERFRGISAVDQGKRKVNQDTLMRQRLEKLEEKLRKVQGENRLKEITHVMFQTFVDMRAALSVLDMGGYEDLRKVVIKNIMEAQRMMEMRSRDQGHGFPPPPPPTMAFPPPPYPHGGAGGSGGHQDERFQSYGPNISMPNMMFPLPQMANMTFPPPPPQGGAGAGRSGGGDQQLVLSHHDEFMSPNHHGRFQSYGPNFSMPNMLSPSNQMANMTFPPPPPQGGAGAGISGGSGQQLVLSHHDEFMSPNQYGRFQSYGPNFSMPNMMFPPPPMANMMFPPPPQGGDGGAGGSGGGGDQQLVLSHHDEFMPPNQYGRFQSPSLDFSLPNMMNIPPSNMSFTIPPHGGAGPSGGGGQQGLSHHDQFMPDPNQYGWVQSSTMPNMEFPPPPPPPNMAFPPPPSMGFPPNDMAYMDPNIGMSYPSNQPMFPYYHNDNIGPHDSSFH